MQPLTSAVEVKAAAQDTGRARLAGPRGSDEAGPFEPFVLKPGSSLLLGPKGLAPDPQPHSRRSLLHPAARSPGSVQNWGPRSCDRNEGPWHALPPHLKAAGRKHDFLSKLLHK